MGCYFVAENDKKHVSLKEQNIQRWAGDKSFSRKWRQRNNL